jgi:hypothetical protein
MLVTEATPFTRILKYLKRFVPENLENKENHKEPGASGSYLKS